MDAKVTKVTGNEWLEGATKTHTLKNTGRIQRKAPHDLNRKTSKLPAVEVPHGGASYNPSVKDHQVCISPSYCLSYRIPLPVKHFILKLIVRHPLISMAEGERLR